MISLFKKQKRQFNDEPKGEVVSVQTQEVEQKKEKPIEQVKAKGVVVQVEKAVGSEYSNVPRDYFHILVKVETPSEATDSNGYQVITSDRALPDIPLAKVGDKVAFSYWPHQIPQVVNFAIDFSARKADVR